MDTELLQTRTSRLYRRVSKLVREKVGKSGHSCPIEYIQGDIPPRVEGRSYHFTTPGGKPVYYPNAYRRAWGKPCYNHSTIKIVVGLKWIDENVK